MGLAGERLRRVVQEGAEPKRGAAGHLVGERLGEQVCDRAGTLAREPLQVALDLEQVREHGDRVVVDVEVVVGRLADPVEGIELGQDGAGRAELAEQLDPAQWVGPADEQAQLGELALAGRLAGARRGGAGERRRAGSTSNPS